MVFFLFSHCSAPGTAFIGPILTGATTHSISQTSLSVWSNQIVKNFKKKVQNKKFSKKRFNYIINDRLNVHID